MKKLTKKRAKKVWKLLNIWAKSGAAITQIPIEFEEKPKPGEKCCYPKTNSLYMKAVNKNLETERELVKVLFDCPDFPSLGLKLGYDKKYNKKTKTKREK